MAKRKDHLSDDPTPRWPVRLTLWGLWAERLSLALWPLLAVLSLFFSFVFMGFHERLSLEAVWAVFVALGLGAVFGLWYAARRFVAPRRAEAVTRVDALMPGQPIRAVQDSQALGAGDGASEAVWAEYQRRMRARLAGARSNPPKVRLARFDPFGLRYVALLLLAVSVLFGSVLRLGSVGEIGAPVAGAAQAAGPSWEGWVEPPRYTGRPAVYLNSAESGVLELPVGSEVTLRLYGDLGAITVTETVSGRTEDLPSAAEQQQSFAVTQDGVLELSGRNGRAWEISALRDTAPIVEPMGPAEAAAGGLFSMPFEAIDDYGISSGMARFALNMDALDRRYGLALPPEMTAPVKVPLPLPIAGERVDFEETLLEDFADHPWANLPVTVTLTAEDEAGQTGESAPVPVTLLARKFFNPMAAAIIELRRDLLWNRENGPRVAQLLRAVSHRPDDVFKRETDYLRLRFILRRLEANLSRGPLTDEAQGEIAEAMWELALKLEDGSLSDALEKMRAAQEKLSEAMRNGASDEEIAELMQELREATEEYMRQLAQQQGQEGEDDEDVAREGDSIQLSQQDLQDMMDRIQELMEQGRMAEAEQALREFQEMMENMRVTEGQQNGQGEGDQAMQGLADTLRDQQGLSDDAFRDLQEQFNPDAQAGRSGQNEGRSGADGRGQQHEGQGEGEGNAEAGRNGSGEDQGEGQAGRSLAERQQDLRRRLEEQRGGMPQLGGEAGEAMREALEGAGRAMREAEDALRQGDLAEAIDRQADAMESLRQGMDNLGEALAENSQGQEGQEGRDARTAGRDGSDPLGRNRRGLAGSEDQMLQNEDVYRRARELLDEIRRRSGERNRSETERNYLERLLDRFR